MPHHSCDLVIRCEGLYCVDLAAWVKSGCSEQQIVPAMIKPSPISGCHVVQGLLKAEGKARFGDEYTMWQRQAEAFTIDSHAPVRELWYRCAQHASEHSLQYLQQQQQQQRTLMPHDHPAPSHAAAVCAKRTASVTVMVKHQQVLLLHIINSMLTGAAMQGQPCLAGHPPRPRALCSGGRSQRRQSGAHSYSTWIISSVL